MKKTISLFLALVFIIATLPVSALAANHATVRYGSRSDDVKLLQEMLNEIDHAGLVEDGIFGAKTRIAVRNFQKANGLVVDGIVGAKTWAKLEEKYNPHQDPVGDNSQGKSTGNTVTATRLSFTATSLEEVQGVKQFTSSDGVGLCTSCATATLLRRRQFLDGMETTFNFGDIRMSLGAKRTDLDNGIYPQYKFKWDNQTWMNSYTIDNGEHVLYTTQSTTLPSNNTAKDKAIELLETHPEGIVVYKSYAKNKKHAIVVTDYTDGKFFAIDPVTNNGIYASRVPLEKTYMYGKCSKSVDKVFSGADVWYIGLP